MVLAPAGRGRQTSAKRGPPSQQDGPSAKRRRVHPQTSRVIAVQTSGKAFGNGQVDVDNFVRAREFEIRALEDSMRRSRNSLSTRAFQNVPRYLRRRTASHNPKKLPKRLRSRAKKEVSCLSHARFQMRFAQQQVDDRRQHSSQTVKAQSSNALTCSKGESTQISRQ